LFPHPNKVSIAARCGPTENRALSRGNTFSTCEQLTLRGVGEFWVRQQGDVLMLDATGIYVTLVNPVLTFGKRIVPDPSTDIQPVGHLLRLLFRWFQLVSAGDIHPLAQLV